MAEKIWILNHYAGHMPFEKGGRHYAFAKFLRQQGCEPVVFASNAQHGNGERFYDSRALWHEHTAEEIGVPFVYVRGNTYRNNGFHRIRNMFGFYRNVQKAARQYAETHGKPEVIVASSVHPLTLLAGLRIAKRFGIGCVCEVRDLWPESFVAYGILKKGSPLLWLLYQGERWLYARADALIFTMEGGRDYIVEKGWDKACGGPIDTEKVFHINNGVDLKQFDENREKYVLEDPDLEDPNTFKIVYTGSIRLVNALGELLDTAKLVKNPAVRFLIWGDGDEREQLEQRVKEEKIENVIFKGAVPKQYVPGITSRADVNLAHFQSTPLAKYGVSLNKLFDYMAAGRPILSDFYSGYNPACQAKAGIEIPAPTPELVAQCVDHFAAMDSAQYETYAANARKAAADYDFAYLTEKLRKVCIYAEKNTSNH